MDFHSKDSYTFVITKPNPIMTIYVLKEYT